METLDYSTEKWAKKQCPPINCHKKQCKCGLEKVFLASALGDDREGSPIAPKNGAYCDAIVVYEANGHIYIYSKEGIPTLITSGGGGDYDEIIREIQEDLAETENNLAQEILDREGADNTLQEEIDAIKNSPDVVDIVPTYAALQAYDTSKLGDNDIIRVLADEQHDGQSTYYRWNKQTEAWTYVGSIQTVTNTIFYADLSEIGSTRHIYKNSDMTGTVSVQELLDANEDGQVILRMSSAQTPENFNDAYLQNTYVGVGDYQFLFLDNRNYYEYDGTATTDTSYYYSKSTIQLELTAGNNITITGNTISATDTTYSNFTGTDGTSAGAAGLVPAPAITDAGKFLKADGTWATAGGGGGGPTVVQTTGTSITDVMSQDATTKLIYPDIANRPYKMVIGEGYIDGTNKGLAINGIFNAGITGGSIAIGAPDANYAQIGQNGRADQSVAIGNTAGVGRGMYSIAIGAQAFVNSGQNTGDNVALGANTYAGNGTATSTVALGAYAKTTRTGEVNIGTGSNGTGYNSTNYRVLGGVHDGQLAQDAATVAQVNATIDAINTALSTNIPHIGA